MKSLWKAASGFLKRMWSPVVPPDQPQENIFVQEIPTREGAKPLKVVARLISMSDSHEMDAWRINVDVRGALHPHNDGSSNLIGSDTLKNPAVVPALAHIRTLLQNVATDLMNDPVKGKKRWSPHHDGGWLCLDCSPNNHEYDSQMSLAQVVPTFQRLTDEVTKAKEDLHRLLDENAHLWPEPATPERMVMFNARAAAEWAKVMAGTATPIAAISVDDQWAVRQMRHYRPGQSRPPGF